MINLIVKNVKAGSLGKLLECIVNRSNTLQMSFKAFNWLLTINATTQAIFKQIIFEKCEQNVRIAKLKKNFFSTVDCASNHNYVWHQVPGRCNFDFIFISSEVTAQTSWRVSSLFSSIAPRHWTQRKKCDDFRLPGTDSKFR